MYEYRYWKVTIKEVGNDTPLVTNYYGYADEKKLVEFFGLKEPDVEWYKLEELEQPFKN